MVTTATWVPDRGDIVWISLNPRLGHEQAGRRPAVVLSQAAYNGRSGLALMCPITSQIKGYPFECVLPAGLPVTGAVLCDQMRSMDWRQRGAEFMARMDGRAMAGVLGLAGALLAAT